MNFKHINPFAMKIVSDILQQKPHSFNYIEPDALVEDALSLMNNLNRSFLIVMHERDFKGIFCEHDYIHNVALRGWDSATCKVEEVMTKDLPTVTPQDSVERVMQLMDAHHVRYVPVFSSFYFEGVITLHDIMHLVVENREQTFDLPLTMVSEHEYRIY
jgi:signal-transduction protein with cAMP-binding, CBS, and nucleotidyltransferase domain